MSRPARAMLPVALAAVALSLTAASATGNPPGTWSAPAPLGSDDTWVDVASVGARPAGRIVLAAHDDRSAGAWVSHGDAGWTQLTLAGGLGRAPLGADGTYTPETENDGCSTPALAAAPSGDVLAVCIAGARPFPATALLPAGSSTFEPGRLEPSTASERPRVAAAPDGTAVVAVGDRGAKDCGGTAWSGPLADASRWTRRTAADGYDASVAAGPDGSLLVAGISCSYPLARPLFVAARRAGGSRWEATRIARPRSWRPTLSAVAPNGRILVAWDTTDLSSRSYEPRWDSIGSAVRAHGSKVWACRPVVGSAACAIGGPRSAPSGRGALRGLRAAQVYAVAALPDSSFVMLLSGIASSTGRPAAST